MRRFFVLGSLGILGALFACSSSEGPSGPAATNDAGGISLGEGGGYVDGSVPDGDKPMVDGGFVAPDGGVIRADRFVTTVVSFLPGPCAGFGTPGMPKVIEGPPVGAGAQMGGLDVLSLGEKGEIILGFDPNAIVDGPGPDFIVFENAFFAAGDPSKPNAELAEVSVSEDGTTYRAFPCAPAKDAPFPGCAGWHPVYSAPGNGISPVDVAKAGGDAFDLADVGLARARFVRIRDLGATACDIQTKPTTTGFDLDAVSIVNAEMP